MSISPALADITPCLESVAWAAQIGVLDSGSRDGTAAIVARYPRARFIQRPFDSHAAQAR